MIDEQAMIIRRPGNELPIPTVKDSMKFALILTPWCGCGEDWSEDREAEFEAEKAIPRDYLDEGPYEPLVWRLFSDYMRGLSGVELTYNQAPNPNPNLVIAGVWEGGTDKDPHKHNGMIDLIAAESRFVVLRQCTLYADQRLPEFETVATAAQLRTYLEKAKFSPVLMDEVIQGEDIDVEQLRRTLKGCERKPIKGQALKRPVGFDALPMPR